ncbi:hypothetical protein [Pseudomonas fluorescens]|uniref:hypothetical protein n=1 Tax=Pseudomonas fluorescens TaxID=294 RepID=UPI00124048B6|nr:hypothetical protein [Pseudomonas fluorescens]
MIDSFFSPRELLFLGMFQVRRFRFAQPMTAPASVNDGERENAWGGQIWSWVDSMAKYLVIVLIGENASRRFSGATFQSRSDGCD